MLIAFEGIDGSGKSTQARLLVENLQKFGVLCDYSKEPTDGVVGQLIREKVLRAASVSNPFAIALLYAADRATHVDQLSQRKEVVHVLDRYFYSSLAYQGVLGVPQEYILKINSFAPIPDIVFLLDIDPNMSLRRLDSFDEFERLDYLAKVRDLYLKLAESFSLIILDADRPPDRLATDILETVRRKLFMSAGDRAPHRDS